MVGLDEHVVARRGDQHARARQRVLVLDLAHGQRPAAVQQPGEQVVGILGAVLDDEHGGPEVRGQAREDLTDGVEAAPGGADDDQTAGGHDRR